jgi:protein-S-isoprenylcysteine O-methyltransferase Ste14
LLLPEVNMAAPLQSAVAAAHKEERLAFLMTPWFDKAMAAITLVPFIWLTYARFRAFGVDLPRVVFATHLLVFIATMITRQTPVRVSTNPWFWLLTFVETYWGVLTFGVMSRGRPIAPHWATDSLAILSVALVIWARLSLGRSIGLVPALRTLLTHGAYRDMRHPIYSAISLSIIAAALNAYSPWNLAIFALGIFWFALKSVVEESFLRSDPGYADRWRWLPGIA